ncbi:MAG: Co2+/Mg2+ efflux protein ApaG [Hydrogenophaga sp.]
MVPYQFTCEVEPHYLAEESRPDDGVFAFAYTVTITNTGQVAAQLIARHWVIEDDQGHTEEVKGLGVVGQQPLLRPGQSFQYTSSTRLRRPSGSMHGAYFCVAEDGERFEAAIPAFVLLADEHGRPRVLH